MDVTTPPSGPRALPGAVTPFHELLALVAQDALEPFWTSMPGRPAPAPALRDAARGALAQYHHGRIEQEELPQAFDAGLDRPTTFLDDILRRDADPRLGLWMQAISANQSRQRFGRMSAPAVNIVLPAYRQDVVGAARTMMQALRTHLRGHALSDWDLFLHASYGFCFEASGEWPESVVLSRLQEMARNALFATYLRQTVCALPAPEQRAMGDAVRAWWADLWSDEATGIAAEMLTERPEDAAAIPDARDLLS